MLSCNTDAGIGTDVNTVVATHVYVRRFFSSSIAEQNFDVFDAFQPDCQNLAHQFLRHYSIYSKRQ